MLNGEHGCSSFGYGVLQEIRPFHVNPDGKIALLQTLHIEPSGVIIFGVSH